MTLIGRNVEESFSLSFTTNRNFISPITSGRVGQPRDYLKLIVVL